MMEHCIFYSTIPGKIDQVNQLLELDKTSQETARYNFLCLFFFSCDNSTRSITQFFSVFTGLLRLIVGLHN